MNKYKLIKKYPNSPELGTIVVKVTIHSDDKYPNQYGSLDNTMFFTVKEIENYPEFWEKVKDYEILELSFKRSERPEIRSVIGYSEEYLEALIKCENIIHSVKRLSDNFIFTVGDKVKYYDKNTEIKSIYYNEHNQLSFKVKGDAAPLTGCFMTNHPHFKKLEKLFTTEDGQDIFEGDTIYPVSDDFQLLITDFAGKKDIRIRCFSTKEKAKEYILMNKPCLSINDLIKIRDRNNVLGMGLIKKAKELVKYKI
jgi:hypothetical protein